MVVVITELAREDLDLKGEKLMVPFYKVIIR